MKSESKIIKTYENKIYCFTSSTRRFRAFPSSVSLVATGDVGPSPQALRLAAFTDCLDTSALTTAAALSIDSFIFASNAPVLSVCPTT